MKRNNFPQYPEPLMLPLQVESCKEAEAIAVIQGLPLLYVRNRQSPLPIPPLHEDFL